MASRPALLLQKQLYALGRLIERQELAGGDFDLIWGIEVSLINGSIFHWRVALNGLFNSQWQGGIFQVDLIFDENYDSYPPYVSFVTIPFHPNIDMNTGCPCMDALLNWDPKTSIIELMVELQVLIQEPVVEGCINGPAGEVFYNSPRLYNQMIQDSIVASRRVQAGLDPFESLKVPIEEEIPAIQSPVQEKKAVKHLAFDKYHEQWLNLATSAQPVNFNHSSFRKEQEIFKNNQYLLYGKFDKKSKRSGDLDHKKLERVQHLKKLYQKPVSVEATSWELEAQELLEWTRSLTTDQIEK